MTFAQRSLYKKTFLAYLKKHTNYKHPKNLYHPISYILALSGKKIRPMLALIGTDIFEGNWKDSLPLALSIEVFHNFTLLHDDIIDEALIRRHKATVHKKWNINTAILSGDAMVILAYTYLEYYQGEVYKEIMKIFNKTALEVCEGQQLDIDFETRQCVSKEEYLKMIELKTSVLLGSSLQLGAIVAKASDENCKQIYNFGLNLGTAFQLQDDYLDTFGESDTFGKKIGGDIIENKKTYLYIEALENANSQQKQELLALYKKNNSIEEKEKIYRVKTIFKNTQADIAIRNQVKYYTEKAFEILEQMDISIEKKQYLKIFGIDLMDRKI